MFSQRVVLSALFLSLLSMAESFAGSWDDEDQSWKTSSPYYYGDSAPQEREASYGTTQRRTKKKMHRERAPFAPDSNNVSLDIGQNFLIGSEYQDSIGLQVSYTYGVSERLAFNSSLGFSSHSEGHYSKLHLLVGPRLNLSTFDRIIPYLNGGLGFYRASRNLNSVTSIAGTMFGLHIGAGADLQLTKQTYFGAALTLHQLFGSTKQTTIGPIDLASNYMTFLAHVGYTF